jgi:glycosyltransferase involved in cell wall biosynthesis
MRCEQIVLSNRIPCLTKISRADAGHDPNSGAHAEPTARTSVACRRQTHREVRSNTMHSPSKLRILIATPLGFRGRGGIDRVTDMIVDTVESRPESNIRLKRLVTRGQSGLLAAQFVFAFALVQLCYSVLRRDVDLLHIHVSDRGSSYRKTILGAVARMLRVPYVAHLHGAVFADFWSNAPWPVSQAINGLFLKSRAIIVLGSYWARTIADRLPSVSENIAILPNATPASEGAPIPAKDGRVRISCIGQLGERKGTLQLIEALNRLTVRSDWVATIAGDGLVEQTREATVKLGLQDRIRIPGWLDSVACTDLLRRTDILVLPSHAENLPMVILEAFAHSVAVISTPVGEIPDAITHEKNGLLIPPGDVAALTAALDRLIRDSDLRRRLGEAGRRAHAERYESDSYVTRLTAIWRRSLGMSELP